MNAIYARQSIDKKDSLSIEGQIELCRKYAGADALIFQDRGFSGKNTRRPAFTALLHAAEEGKIRKIYVYRLDRFSRSIADFSRLWDELERCGVQFNSVTEQFDTGSPIGRAMLNIVLVFAQLERETIAERVRDNYLHRFSLGAWPGGPAPYGYDIVKIRDGDRTVSSLAANEKANVVIRIFDTYGHQGASLRGIAKALSAEGIHGPKRETWDSATLSRLLRSPLYVRADADVMVYYLGKGIQSRHAPAAFDGVHACNVIGRRASSGGSGSGNGPVLAMSNHEGLIDAALWLRVQDRLSEQVQLPRHGAGKHSWLTGLLKCAKCGHSIKICPDRNRSKYYLCCSGRSNLTGCDASIRVDLRDLEQQTSALIRDALCSAPPEKGRAGAPQDAACALAIDQKIARLVSALSEAGEVAASYIEKEIERLHRQRDALLLSAAKGHSDFKALDFDALRLEEKRMVAAELIDRILLNGDHADIIWKV